MTITVPAGMLQYSTIYKHLSPASFLVLPRNMVSYETQALPDKTNMAYLIEHSKGNPTSSMARNKSLIRLPIYQEMQSSFFYHNHISQAEFSLSYERSKLEVTATCVVSPSTSNQVWGNIQSPTESKARWLQYHPVLSSLLINQLFSIPVSTIQEWQSTWILGSWVDTIQFLVLLGKKNTL